MTARMDQARHISDLLDGLDEADVHQLIDAADPVGLGIGGSTKKVCVGETTVFVKQLPLTSVEESAPTSTARRVQLPFVCHYGIGSPTHGVGRELAAHQVTSAWVQDATVDFFPILLGWRVVDLKCQTDLSEFDGDAAPRQWGRHWPQVNKQLTAMKDASKSLVLFLEYVPETLGDWIRKSLAAGQGAKVFADVVDQIIDATAWMRTQGFQHFDVHPGNILVQNGRLLFTDFGLSLYRGFELTAEERTSMVTQAGFDRDTALMHLFHWILFEIGYTSAQQRLTLLRAVAVDPAAPAVDPVRKVLGASANVIAQHAHAAVYVTEMFGSLLQDASATVYGSARDRAIQ